MRELLVQSNGPQNSISFAKPDRSDLLNEFLTSLLPVYPELVEVYGYAMEEDWHSDKLLWLRYIECHAINNNISLLGDKLESLTDHAPLMSPSVVWVYRVGTCNRCFQQICGLPVLV